MGFLCVLKIYHISLFIVEKMGFGMTHRLCGIHSKPTHYCRKFVFHMLLKPQLCSQEHACIRMIYLVHAGLD